MLKQIEINKYIVADPQICHGKPTFKGSRIMVWQILDMLKVGQNTQDIIKAFPSLTPRHIEAAFDYAVSLAKGEKNIVVSFPT